MKLGFFPKLALDGIRKNKRLYFPYILTCAGMVMMFYIIHYLAAMPILDNMAGGRSTMQMLEMGTWIMVLFSFLFLFYTNSFLMRRRQKEFGLYNVLGMGKAALSIVLLWETVFLFAVSMAMGLVGGIALSKLAELGLMYVIQGTVTYDFSVNWIAVLDTFVIFSPIFLLIYLKSLVQLWHFSAVSLLKSENTGEKAPRANYLLGLAGILLLGAAYYIAVSIQSPLSALAWFFIAVGMVIVATYLLFISGSVMLCRLLQRNKGYYYKKQHFISVSSMTYRMKRNGAGLASICILITMVFVMSLGAGSLYFGAEDSLRSQYPKDIEVAFRFRNTSEDSFSKEKADRLEAEVRSVIDGMGVKPKNEECYVSAAVTGIFRHGQLMVDYDTVNSSDINTMEEVCIVYFIPLEDYNRCMGVHETLEKDQILLHFVSGTYDEPTITLSDGTVWQVKKQVAEMMEGSDMAINAVHIVVTDLQQVMDTMNAENEDRGEWNNCSATLSYCFDTDQKPEERIALYDAIYQRIRELATYESPGFTSYSTVCRDAERADFYGIYGGLFYLGIILSIVFLLATVLIIYYKQITEGYEDEGRFEIMQKVGMSRAEIRKSVNSQILTVFFLPLVTAAVHLCFAFPMVQKLLMLFNFHNQTLILTVMAVTVLVFGSLYALIYKLTANAYFSIVSGGRDD